MRGHFVVVMFPSHQTSFVVDEVSNIIKEAVEGTIGGNAYQHNKINQWTSNVVEQCLNQLTKLGKPFKYIGENSNKSAFGSNCLCLNSLPFK